MSLNSNSIPKMQQYKFLNHSQDSSFTWPWTPQIVGFTKICTNLVTLFPSEGCAFRHYYFISSWPTQQEPYVEALEWLGFKFNKWDRSLSIILLLKSISDFAAWRWGVCILWIIKHTVCVTYVLATFWPDVNQRRAKGSFIWGNEGTVVHLTFRTFNWRYRVEALLTASSHQAVISLFLLHSVSLDQPGACVCACTHVVGVWATNHYKAPPQWMSIIKWKN